MKTIEIKRECPSCEGTGLYRGMSERDGFAVVCHHCKGEGWNVIKLEYNDPPEKKLKLYDVHTVLERNPGIVCGVNPNILPFGGIPYIDWINGKTFPVGSEMRNYTCPRWWYRGRDKEPRWNKCNHIWGRSFSDCECFPTKDLCWEQWSKENEI